MPRSGAAAGAHYSSARLLPVSISLENLVKLSKGTRLSSKASIAVKSALFVTDALSWTLGHFSAGLQA